LVLAAPNDGFCEHIGRHRLGRAVGWLHEHLGDYDADPARIYVAGHSAGRHLTAMTMPLGAVMHPPES
jgi:acetyl esterase/lipase